MCLISESRQNDCKKILFNPNIVAMLLGLLLFLFRVQLPDVIASCVSGFGQMISPASMLVIGMAIGNVDLKWVFTQKRPYLICFFRLIVYPILGVIGFGILGQMGIHPDAEYILMVVLLATAATGASEDSCRISVPAITPQVASEASASAAVCWAGGRDQMGCPGTARSA